jgi:hypothetical protein
MRHRFLRRTCSRPGSVSARRGLGGAMRTLGAGTALVVLLSACGRSADRTSKTTAGKTSIHELVEQVLTAYGGRENLVKVHAWRAEGPLTAVQRDQEGETVRWFERPDRLRIEIRYPDRGEVRITRGEKGWAGSDDRHLEPVEGAFLQSMRLQTGRLDLPLRLAEQESSLTVNDPDEKGRTVLRLPLEGGLTLDYHIDPESHRIERMVMSMPGPPAMSFEADLSEFHFVDGVLFPYREDIPGVLFAPDRM